MLLMFFNVEGDTMKNVSRRDFVGASAAAAALALAGCGSTSSTPEAQTTASEEVEAESLGLVTEGKLTVATSPDYPPFENLEDGEYVGMDMELATLVAEKLELEVEFKTVNFDAIISAISAGGQADLGWSGITIDPDRAKQVVFSDPYYTDDLCVVTMKSNADITEDNYAEALNAEGMILACQSGTTAETYIAENFSAATAQPYTNATDCYAALQSGQCTAVVTNWAVGASMLDAYPDAQMIGEIATGEEYGVAINKDNAALLMAVNGCLEELEEDGTLDEVVTKWMTAE